MISKEEFKNYIDSLMPQDLKDKIEKEKHGYKIGGIVCVCVGAAMAIISLISIILSLSMFTTTFCIGVIILGFMLIIIGLVIKNSKSDAAVRFEKQNKAKIIAKLLEDQKFVYDKNSFIAREMLKGSCFVHSSIDRYSGEDLLIIKLDEHTNLYISDVCAEEEHTTTDDDGNTTTSYTTLYRGAFGYVSFKNQFKCDMFINCRAGYNFKAQKVSLEDIEFNKCLKTSATDQIEARLILSPDVMQKLKNLEKIFSGLKISFVGSLMFFGAPHTDLFKITKRSKNYSGDNFMRIYDDIAIILGIIDEIKNNDRIFKKEGE